MASGYYQVPMAEDSIEKTAFITPDAHMEFLRMPFGLSNSPAVYQRLINTVLGDLKNQIAFPYIDDIIVPTSSFEEGLSRLRKVLNVLKENGLTLKLSKCSFFKTKIDYLGREISAGGVRPGSTKVKAVLDFPNPQNVKQIRQFLGLAGYFRKFIEHFAQKVEPLTRLLKKNVTWQWNEEQIQAIQSIKAALASNPILAIFDPQLPTELHTDACSIGVAGILMQRKAKEIKVIGYFSKQTTTEQRMYHSYELETLAVVLSLQYFRVYLLGIQFKVITDCSALRSTFVKKDLLPRVGRWWLQVLDYTFDVEHRSGTKMWHVDALSRNPIAEEINVIDLTEGEWIIVAQSQDDQIAKIKEILTSGHKNEENKLYFKEYVLKHDKVYKKLPDGKLAWLVPKSCRWQICRLCHDESGHFGFDKTLRRISENYWFPKMRRFVKKYVQACMPCMYYKHPASRKEGKMYPIEKVPVPFHTLHLDHLGPFEKSSRGNRYILTIVDGFTKFIVLEAVKDTKARHVVKTLMSLMYLFGAPTRIITDRGTAFTSKVFKTFCEAYGIHHVLNAVATPRANGQCERMNRTVLNTLAVMAAGDDESKWDTYVKPIQGVINCTQNKTIGVSPLEVFAGYKGRNIAEAKVLSCVQNEIERLDLKKVRKEASKRIAKDQEMQKKRFDQARAEAKQYKEGEVVMISITDHPATGSSRKLLPVFKGPFKVTKILHNDRYEVEDSRENMKRRRTVVAVDKMKPWVLFEGELTQVTQVAYGQADY